MSGVDQAAAATKRAVDRAKSMHPIQTGAIASVSPGKDGYVIQVDLPGYRQTVTRFSAPFRAELAANAAAPEKLIGVVVEVHFNQGLTPAIAYTIGV